MRNVKDGITQDSTPISGPRNLLLRASTRLESDFSSKLPMAFPSVPKYLHPSQD